MDITTYDNILDGLKAYNEKAERPYGNSIVSIPTAKPTYPYTIIDEIRNISVPSLNGLIDKVSRVGYKVDIYAKTKGNVTKQTIARRIAQVVDEYLTGIGLFRESYNIFVTEVDGSIYHIIMVYTGVVNEYRRNLI